MTSFLSFKLMIIAGERSGVGKTTITLAILAYLTSRGDRVQSFKVGPDYIDPMFHSYFTGRPCRNLDPVLTSEDYVKTCFAQHCQSVDYALIEGVMGLFDGIQLTETQFPDYASTAHIARILGLPLLLVIDCSRLSTSVAAIVRGYQSLDKNLHLAGVILNRVGSDRHLQLLQTALESINMPIVGVLRRQDSLTIPDRHLGLVPTDELAAIKQLQDQLAHTAQNCFNWDILLPLLSIDPKLNISKQSPENKPFSSLRVGIARDKAFNFYYPDNLDILANLGAELIFWSPLQERNLPENLQGLYFGGGFPEIFAAELAANTVILTQVRKAIASGMPTYAECGGLMYLCDKIIDFEEKNHNMLQIIPQSAIMSPKLTLGYRQAIAPQETILLNKGQQVRGHEFHRSHLSGLSNSPIYQLQAFPSSATMTEGWCNQNLHASYLHLHFGGDLDIPKKFLAASLDFFRKAALS
jgi:cobyrinic acid a,c-diamide synthase